MKKRALLLVLLIVAALTVYASTKAQSQNGLAVRLRIQKVTEGGVLPRTLRGNLTLLVFRARRL
jgi:hypothetical protein